MSEDRVDSVKFQIGDLVWAKMKGYTPWPGKVSEHRGNVKKPKTGKNCHFIFFFGSNNFGWIEETCLQEYETNKEKLKVACKTAPFKDAVTAIENYVKVKETGEIPPEDMVVEEGSLHIDTKSEGESMEEEKIVVEKKKVGRKKKIVTETNGVASDDAKPKLIPKKRKSTHDDKKGSPVGSPIASGSKVNSTPRSKFVVRNFLNRPSQINDQASAPVDVTLVSQDLKDKNIIPSTMRFGFLGCGIMGTGIIKNLMHSGHQVTIWNRSPEKCTQFKDAGADIGMTPSDVISAADITFSCVSDPTAAKEMVFGNCGVLQEINATKNYVEMTGMDSESSEDIGDAIQAKGGRYLEAQIQGSKSEAESGNLVIIAAGNKSLFDECESAFQAMAKKVFYVGNIGNASKLNLIIQMLNGITLAGLGEAFALADRVGLDQNDLLDILKETSVASPLVMEKAPTIIALKFPVKQALQHLQKDLKLAVLMGDSCEQHLPVAATVNEVFKHARRLGYSEQDVAAVSCNSRF